MKKLQLQKMILGVSFLCIGALVGGCSKRGEVVPESETTFMEETDVEHDTVEESELLGKVVDDFRPESYGETQTITANVNNPFVKEGTSVYDVVFWTKESETTVSIQPIKCMENGTVYKMDTPEDWSINGYGTDRFPIYLYVTEDTIYRTDKDEAQIMVADTEKQLLEGAHIICSQEACEDPLDAEEKGWHEYVEVQGTQRIYHGYDTMVETGYYESFTWEEGKGLVEYYSGYGAMKDAVELTQQ